MCLLLSDFDTENAGHVVFFFFIVALHSTELLMHFSLKVVYASILTKFVLNESI